MAVIQVAQIPVVIVGLPTSDPSDVESDVQTAARSTINVNIPGSGGYRGLLTIEPIAQPDSGLATPVNGALTQTAGGSLGAVAYYVRSTYVNENGAESPLSAETSLAVSANNLLNVASPAASSGAVYWRPYVSTASGAETLQAQLPIGTAFVEPTTGLVAGAAPNQLGTLVNGPATLTITQGAGAFSLTAVQ